MAVAPLAPEAVAATDVLVILAAALGWAACIGLLWAWNATFGALLNALAGVLSVRISLGFTHVTLPFGGPIRRLDNTIQHQISAWASGMEYVMGRCFHALGVIFEWQAHEIAGLAQNTLSLGHWLVHTYVPTYVHGVTDTLHATTRTVTRVVRVTETKVVRVERAAKATAAHAAAVTVPGVAIPHVGEWQWLHRHWQTLRRLIEGAGVIAVPGLVTGAWGEIRDLLRWRPHVNTRLRRVEALLGATAMAAAMANVLGVSARCLRSGNVGRVARAVCGLSAEALRDVLGLLADVFIVTEICEVIPLLTEAFSLVESPLNDLVGAAGGALCHGDFDAPPVLAVPPLALPPVQGTTPALAV